MDSLVELGPKLVLMIDLLPDVLGVLVVDQHDGVTVVSVHMFGWWLVILVGLSLSVFWQLLVLTWSYS